MPLVTIETLKGVLSSEQKRRLIEGVTESVLAVEGEAARPLTWVRIHEFEQGEWAVGGRLMYAADVHALCDAPKVE